MEVSTHRQTQIDRVVLHISREMATRGRHPELYKPPDGSLRICTKCGFFGLLPAPLWPNVTRLLQEKGFTTELEADGRHLIVRIAAK